MVAAWISADTGVGPSIASGSHTCSGSWADLPTAPANSSRAMTVAVPFGSPRAAWNTGPKSREWNFSQMKTIPMRKAESPIRVVTKAFLAASAAALRSNQNPISRYEHRPTPSQPRYRSRKFWARTSVSMKKQNRFM